MIPFLDLKQINQANEELPIHISVKSNNYEPTLQAFDISAYNKDSTGLALHIAPNFKALKEYKHVDEFLANYNRRVVKAKNGLIIRDSLGAKIGKYNFLESVSSYF